MDWKLIALAVGLTTMTGCKGSTIVVGNLTTMAIVVVMLWSTLNIDRG